MKKATEQEGEVTTTIALDREQHKQLRLLAVHRETTVRNLLREAVSEYLKKHGGRQK
jgi:predicted transcriptional regulator